MEAQTFPKFQDIIPGERVVRSVFNAVRNFVRPEHVVRYAQSDHCPDHLLGLAVGETPKTGAAVMIDEALYGRE